jgi:hypothetical protein
MRSDAFAPIANTAENRSSGRTESVHAFGPSRAAERDDSCRCSDYARRIGRKAWVGVRGRASAPIDFNQRSATRRRLPDFELAGDVGACLEVRGHSIARESSGSQWRRAAGSRQTTSSRFAHVGAQTGVFDGPKTTTSCLMVPRSRQSPGWPPREPRRSQSSSSAPREGFQHKQTTNWQTAKRASVRSISPRLIHVPIEHRERAESDR